MAKCIAAISGGLDSVTMGHYLIKENNFDVQAVFIHYGQKHKTLELKYAKQFAENFTKNNLIELSILTKWYLI
jgi:7-cyano-7-deazaguanine synthase in queuosine biosynthesis